MSADRLSARLELEFDRAVVAVERASTAAGVVDHLHQQARAALRRHAELSAQLRVTIAAARRTRRQSQQLRTLARRSQCKVSQQIAVAEQEQKLAAKRATNAVSGRRAAAAATPPALAPARDG